MCKFVQHHDRCVQTGHCRKFGIAVHCALPPESLCVSMAYDRSPLGPVFSEILGFAGTPTPHICWRAPTEKGKVEFTA
jgi:hypothetical protein